MRHLCRAVIVAVIGSAIPLIGAFGAPRADLFVMEISGAQTVATPVPDVIPKAQYQLIAADGLLTVGPVDIAGAISFQNDGKYAEQQPGYWAGFNATLDSGGVAVNFSPFSLRAGRFLHADVVHSPYSLFVSSRPLPVIQLDLAFESDRFFYTSRWLGLNRNSRLPGVEERGANIRSYGARIGSLRIGFQDVLVYADRQFDYEYLMSPIPGFFLQYVKVATGNPWSEAGNDNSIVGLFADYGVPSFYAYAQLLVDDFNANAFLNPDSFQNPNKIAWSVGGIVPTRVGEFGFYHAGATKYTFQAYGSGAVGSATDTKYGYTLYPAVEYAVGGETREILPEDNYIGYLHGENNLAFLLEYAQEFGPVNLDAGIEYTLSGSKSPANPWHEFNSYSDGGQGTRFLEDDRLESKIAATARAASSFGVWNAFIYLSAGIVINELQLTSIPVDLAGPNNEIRYYSPVQSGPRVSGGITIGGSIRLPL